MFVNSKLIGTAIVLAVSLVSTAPAATITWGPVTNVDPNNVSQVQDGLGYGYFDAATVNSTTTLNGILFHGQSGVSATAPDGGSQMSFSGSNIKINDIDSQGVYGSAPATPYAQMLHDGTYRSAGSSPAMSIVIGGLSVGQVYQVQLFMPYWDNQFPTQFTAGNSTPFLNTGNNVLVNPSMVPQFIVGRFTADATSETILTAGSNGYELISAIAVTAAPEPGSIALAIIGMAGLLVVVRRRQQSNAAARQAQ